MKKEIKNTIDSHLDELKGIVKKLYENPEIGNEEFKTVKLLCDYLEEQGFDVQREYIVKTGFRAEYDTHKKGRTVAILCEYDALPEIGHGCGHNLIAGIGIGAGLGLKSVIDQIGGKLVVLGTPAEENFGGKVSMVEANAFDDIDFAMICHPNAKTKLGSKTLALKPLKFEFFGKTSHASSQPEKGINALDAAVLTYVNINLLRQYMPSHARIHGIIRNGGEAANIIPDYASMEYYFRGADKFFVEDLANKAINCAKAAAMSTGCDFKHSIYEAQYDNIVENVTLLNVYRKNLSELGVGDITVDDSIGSTDMGNVSYVVPSIHPYIGIGGNVTGHSRELAKQTITEEGSNALKIAANCLANTAVDVLANDKLFAEIYEEFEKNTKKA